MKVNNRKNTEISQLTSSLSSVESIRQENVILHDQIEKLVHNFILHGISKSIDNRNQ